VLSKCVRNDHFVLYRFEFSSKYDISNTEGKPIRVEKERSGAIDQVSSFRAAVYVPNKHVFTSI
jgi:hypothetical protein